MTTVGLRFDLRAPDFASPREVVYATALELAAYADGKGFDFVQISEHHGAADGYCPAPTVFAAALAARTKAVRVRISALIAPLHHPVRLAEDLAVLDIVSGGRLEVVLGAGYRPYEFTMLGIEAQNRGRLVEEAVAVLRSAWRGEEFSFRGAKALVRPRPLQEPVPLMLGGSSPAAARRAARLAMDFLPTNPALYDVLDNEREKLGLGPGRRRIPGPYFLYVTSDPEAAWAELAPYLLHDTNAYAAWLAEGAQRHGNFKPVQDAAALRALGSYLVATPEEVVSMAAELGDEGTVMLHPVVSGLPPELAWPSVELFTTAVLPLLERRS